MPVEVRRFGVGHRRPDGPPGTTGIEGQVIRSEASGVISELAFDRHARIAPHTNPSWTYFLVIEGGGWVGVGDERVRVQAGEAVTWPPDVLHAAWTDGAPMRAIVVEFAESALALGSGVVDGAGTAKTIPSGAAARPVTKGEGSLAPRPGRAVRHAFEPEDEGEPL